MKKFKIVDFSHLQTTRLQDAVNDGWELEKVHTDSELCGWALLSKEEVEDTCGNEESSPKEVRVPQPVWVNVAPMGEEGWKLLGKQKRFLCEIINYIESEPSKFRDPDLLSGLLNFLDHIQDSAVDDAGVPEHVVFPCNTKRPRQHKGC